jgi:hypothetical protein
MFVFQKYLQWLQIVLNLIPTLEVSPNSLPTLEVSPNIGSVCAHEAAVLTVGDIRCRPNHELLRLVDFLSGFELR